MRALCFNGINDLRVERVPDPAIVNPHDAILKVRMSTTCGSDLHIIDGYIPSMLPGDILGHEFMGEIVETGPAVTRVKTGERVVVPSFVCCGSCSFCRDDLWSLCDNTNPNAVLQEPLLGYPTAGIYGYTQAFGGYAGAHAEYVRVPFADVNCFAVPDKLRDDQLVFLSDAAPTGFMGSDLAGIVPGDTVAVWGCGGVGLFAIWGSALRGARVIAVDRLPERLALARRFGAAETIDAATTGNVVETLKEMSGGRGPDRVIEAVGMEARGNGLPYAIDRVKQSLRIVTDRASALRQAIVACRKGGTLVILGVYGMTDSFPLGVIMNKGLTVRSAQQHGQKYVAALLEYAANGDFDASLLATHRYPLDDAPRAYADFRDKTDGVIRAVFVP